MMDQADKLASAWERAWLETSRHYLFMDLEELAPVRATKRNRVLEGCRWALGVGNREFDSSGESRPRKRKRPAARGLLWVPA